MARRTERDPFASVWQDFEEAMAQMQGRLGDLFEGARALPGPEGGETGRRWLPTFRADFQVDVREHDDEIIVVADLPGVEKENVSVRLVDPRTLAISTERREETEEEKEGYYRRERMFGTMRREIPLPDDASAEDAGATFKNGVLEVRLKKAPEKRGKQIDIG